MKNNLNQKVQKRACMGIMKMIPIFFYSQKMWMIPIVSQFDKLQIYKNNKFTTIKYLTNCLEISIKEVKPFEYQIFN